MSTLSFDGDVIVVTGAGGGMGRCHALELAQRGARVIVNDLGGHPFGGGSDPGLAEQVVAEIREAGGEAVANTQSVSTVEGAASLTEQAMDEWGRLDAVVANAAILRDMPFDEMTVQDFDDVIDVNLRGVMRVFHPAFKVMKANGGGRLVAVTSSSGMVGARAQTNYGAAKSGLLGLTRALALEGEDVGIKANLLAPGALGHPDAHGDGGGRDVPRRRERGPGAERGGGGVPEAGAGQPDGHGPHPSHVPGDGADPVLLGRLVRAVRCDAEQGLGQQGSSGHGGGHRRELGSCGR